MPRIAASVGVLALIAFSIAFNTSRYPKIWDVTNGPSHSMQPVSSTQPGSFANQSRTSGSGYGAAATRSLIPPDALGAPHTLAPDDMESDGKDRIALPRETRYGQSPGMPGDKESAADASSAPRAIEQAPSLREPGRIAGTGGLPSYDDSYATAAKPPREARSGLKYTANVPQAGEPSASSDPQSSDGPQTTDGPSLSPTPEAPARRLVPVVYPGSEQGSAEKSTSSARGVLRLPAIDRLGSEPAERTPSLPMDPIPIYPSTGVE